jgi:hypothetical protein
VEETAAAGRSRSGGVRHRRGLARALAWVAGGLALTGVLALARWGPGVALAVAMAVPSAGAWLGSVLHQPVAREQVLVEVAGQHLETDVYRPAQPRRALLLVHGLSAAGRRHPELMRLAGLLAGHGQLVMVPHFPSLAAFRLEGHEVEQVRASLRHLTRAALPLGVAGFSFGAGPALIAAAAMPEVDLVGSFGGYADLRNVIVFVTTGAHDFRTRREWQPQEEYNRWKLLALLVGFVDGGDRERLHDIAQRRLANPADDTTSAEAGLGESARAMLGLVRARREDEVRQRLAQLPPRVHRALDALAPLPAVPRLTGRLLIAHGADDASIPFTESLRLAEAAGPRAHVAILSGFHHTGLPAGWPALRSLAHDGWRFWRIAADLIAG